MRKIAFCQILWDSSCHDSLDLVKIYKNQKSKAGLICPKLTFASRFPYLSDRSNIYIYIKE